MSLSTRFYRSPATAALALLAATALTVGVAAADDEDGVKGAAPAASASASGSASAAAEPAPAPAPAAPAEKAAPKADSESEDDAPIEPPVDRKGEEQFIGLQLTSLNKIDPTKNTWEFDALLTISTKGKLRKCEKKAIQKLFPEGELKKVDEVEDHQEGELKVRSCKVTVEESSDIDISRYPFDKPTLTVDIGDDGDSAEGVVFKPLPKDGFGLTPKATLPGWEVTGITGEAVAADPAKQQSSRVVVSVETRRPLFSSFIKAFLAVLLQLVISMIGLFLPMKVIANRLTLTTAALIAVAATHSTITNQINVAYLTTTDKIFMAAYLTLVVNLLVNVFLMRADDQKKEAVVKQLSSVGAIAVPVLALLSVTLVLLGVI